MNNEEYILKIRPNKHYDLALYQYGSDEYFIDNKFRPFNKNCLYIVCIFSGKGVYKTKNKVYNVIKGDFLFVSPDDFEDLEQTGEEPLKFLFVGFNGIDAKRLLENVGFFGDFNNGVIHPAEKTFEKAFGYLSEICSVAVSDEKSYLRNVAFLLLFFSSIFIKDVKIANLSHDNNGLWTDVCDYIYNNYSLKLSVASLSKRFAVTRTSLYRLFVKNAKVSPNQFIANLRLGKAYELVKNTQMLFVEIALDCGFSDQAYFYKCFKNKYKKTPKQVREEMQTDWFG